MEDKRALHKLRGLLKLLSDNNKDEQEAIGEYYELLKAIHEEREASRWFFNAETMMSEDLSVEPDGEESEEKIEARRAHKIRCEYLDKCEKIVKDNIAEEKKHSLLLNSLAMELDDIQPEID